MRWMLLASVIVANVAKGVASDTYDYVIVGGGTFGLVIANRFTDDPRSKAPYVPAGTILNPLKS